MGHPVYATLLQLKKLDAFRPCCGCLWAPFPASLSVLSKYLLHHVLHGRKVSDEMLFFLLKKKIKSMYIVLTVFTWKKKSWNIQEESDILTGLDCFHNYYVFAEQIKVRIVQKIFSIVLFLLYSKFSNFVMKILCCGSFSEGFFTMRKINREKRK